MWVNSVGGSNRQHCHLAASGQWCTWDGWWLQAIQEIGSVRRVWGLKRGEEGPRSHAHADIDGSAWNDRGGRAPLKLRLCRKSSASLVGCLTEPAVEDATEPVGELDLESKLSDTVRFSKKGMQSGDGR
jgi:hypothetical protein